MATEFAGEILCRRGGRIEHVAHQVFATNRDSFLDRTLAEFCNDGVLDNFADLLFEKVDFLDFRRCFLNDHQGEISDLTVIAGKIFAEHVIFQEEYMIIVLKDFLGVFHCRS